MASISKKKAIVPKNHNPRRRAYLSKKPEPLTSRDLNRGEARLKDHGML